MKLIKLFFIPVLLCACSNSKTNNVANYTIEDTADIVVHQRISSSLPVVWGTTVRRALKFSEDTLILRVLNGNRRLKWIKQK